MKGPFFTVTEEDYPMNGSADEKSMRAIFEKYKTQGRECELWKHPTHKAYSAFWDCPINVKGSERLDYHWPTVEGN